MSVLDVAPYVHFGHDGDMARRRGAPKKIWPYDRVVGARVCRLREARGLSMEELGALVDPRVSSSQINKLEKGQVKMTLEYVHQLSVALGVRPLELLAPEALLSPREGALVGMHRLLDERGQETVWRVADALPKSDVNDDPAGGGAGSG